MAPKQFQGSSGSNRIPVLSFSPPPLFSFFPLSRLGAGVGKIGIGRIRQSRTVGTTSGSSHSF